jgi:beta-lactamase class A
MPVAIAAVKQIQDGKWKWDSKLVIFEEDVDTKFGTLGNLPIGTKLTIEELITELLTKSDNTAYKMLLRNLGAGPVNNFLTETGLNDFFDKDLNITVKEYTRLFRTLYTSSYLKREYSEKILDLLSKSERNYLGQAIPSEIKYSHKFGENVLEKIYADSGIVFLPDRPFVITVLYKGGEADDKIRTDLFFFKVSSIVYNI